MSPGWRGIFQSGSSVLEGSDNGKGGGFLNFFPLDMMKLCKGILYQKLPFPNCSHRQSISKLVEGLVWFGL